MTARSPGAFVLSVLFHAMIIGAIFVFTVLGNEQEKVSPKVLELVAGEGDNFGATVAPALGDPAGLKVKIPEPPKPTPEPIVAPAPVEPEPSPMTPPPQLPKPTPTPPKPTPTPTKAPDTIPNFKRQIQRKVWAADAKAKKEVAKQRAEDERRAKAAAAAERKAAATRVPRIDGAGIAKGVIGGSTENTVGGAGGKALVASEGTLSERYFAMLKERVQNALDKPPGLSDDLAVTVVVHIAANGRLSNAHVVKSSGSEEFDRAVIAAFGRVTMPEHPEHKSEDLELIFRTKESGEG
jgi:colicin import membrane protein